MSIIKINSEIATASLIDAARGVAKLSGFNFQLFASTITPDKKKPKKLISKVFSNQSEHF